MLITLILLGAERLINALLAKDLIDNHHHLALIDKTIRISLGMPEITLDVRFCEQSVRFLPVYEPIFEQTTNDFMVFPDCIVSFTSGKDLLQLLKNPYQMVNLSGDDVVWQHMQALIADAIPILTTQNQTFWQSFGAFGEWIKSVYFDKLSKIR